MTHPDEQAEQIRQQIEDEALGNPSVQQKLRRLQEASEHAQKYPECTKLSAHREDILALQRFFDWCIDDRGDAERMYLRDAYSVYSGRQLELLIYKYFDIDPKKLEDERRAMLEEQRETNER